MPCPTVLVQSPGPPPQSIWFVPSSIPMKAFGSLDRMTVMHISSSAAVQASKTSNPGTMSAFCWTIGSSNTALAIASKLSASQ